jgi:hypothetical protein
MVTKIDSIDTSGGYVSGIDMSIEYVENMYIYRHILFSPESIRNQSRINTALLLKSTVRWVTGVLTVAVFPEAPLRETMLDGVADSSGIPERAKWTNMDDSMDEPVEGRRARSSVDPDRHHAP